MPDHLRNGTFVFSANPRAYIQITSSPSISLGDAQNISLALTQSELSLPDPQSIIDGAFALGFPQVLAFATACMGLYFAIKLLRSFTP